MEKIMPCRHRGEEIAPGTFYCHSPKLVTFAGVNKEVCNSCPVRDHKKDTLRAPANASTTHRRKSVKKPVFCTRKIIFVNTLSPGDCLVSTAAIESLIKTYPKRYEIGVRSSCDSVFLYNPNLSVLDPSDSDVQMIELHYPLIHKSNQLPIHFMDAYVDYIAEMLGVPLKLTINRPVLYFHQLELKPVTDFEDYVVINAGHKNDFTCKFWGHHHYQEVVNAVKGLKFIQIGEDNPNHVHKPLDGAINMIGKTNPRQLMRLCLGAKFGMGPVSFIQHIFAALEKPYIAIMGGRENPYWTHYNTQTVLSTVGTLPCCATGGCWTSRVAPLNDGSDNDKNLCKLPVISDDGELIPKCMETISVRSVVEAIERLR